MPFLHPPLLPPLLPLPAAQRTLLGVGLLSRLTFRMALLLSICAARMALQLSQAMPPPKLAVLLIMLVWLMIRAPKAPRESCCSPLE